MDFIQRHYESRFPLAPRAAELMSVPLRSSSRGDYERKWQHFLTYLHSEGVQLEQVSLQHVLNFLIMLFDKRKLLAHTIAHYRSALSVPLREALNIDILSPAVSSMMKAMSISRPSRPFTAPSWNLQNVLDYTEGMTGNLSYVDCLSKSAFLLLLATGWRISELHACVKLSDYCSIDQANVLKIRPHESFLAKNESSHSRWSHTAIQPLLVNNAPSSLCPVVALKTYLAISFPKGHGSLFVHETGKPLTQFELSKLVCQHVLNGDPSAKAKVHDIRKFASSLSLMKHRDVKDVLTAMDWKSSRAFFKHYLMILPRPSQAVSIPGGSLMFEDEEISPN